MYERHFGLNRAPFRITPDPDLFFPGGNRGAVLEALVYAVTRGEGIIKVVGEVGSGKTMICRMLERELPATCEKIYLANPRLGPADILHAIAFELGLAVTPGDSRAAVLHRVNAHLLGRHAENVRVTMFVEEAQSMPVDTLEELRLISNLETTKDKLLQIVLFGQPELDAKLELHEIRQLRERITHSFELKPLDPEEIRDYLSARLRASGYRGNALFTRGAIREIARSSRGLLRRINILADKALLAAFAANASMVGAGHVRLAARDSEFRRADRRPRWGLWAVLALALAGVTVGAWMLGPVREFFPLPVARVAPPARIEATAAKLAAGAGGEDGGARLRASSAVSAAAPTGAGAIDDNRALIPVVSPTSGLVGHAHLRPLIQAPAGAWMSDGRGGSGAP